MLKQNTIKTNKELEFAVFCIENLAAALHTDARTVYRLLCDKSSILKDSLPRSMKHFTHRAKIIS